MDIVQAQSRAQSPAAGYLLEGFEHLYPEEVVKSHYTPLRNFVNPRP